MLRSAALALVLFLIFAVNPLQAQSQPYFDQLRCESEPSRIIYQGELPRAGVLVYSRDYAQAYGNACYDDVHRRQVISPNYVYYATGCPSYYYPSAWPTYTSGNACIVYSGNGGIVYYDCDNSRRVRRVTRHVRHRTTHHRDTRTRHYWRNYGAPYGDHGGYIDGHYVPAHRGSRQSRVVISRNRRGSNDRCSNMVVHRRRQPRVSTSYRSSRSSRGMTLRSDPRRTSTTHNRRAVIRRPSNSPRFGGGGYYFGSSFNRPVQRSNSWIGSPHRRGPSQTIRSHSGLHHRRP